MGSKFFVGEPLRLPIHMEFDIRDSHEKIQLLIPIFFLSCCCVLHLFCTTTTADSPMRFSKSKRPRWMQSISFQISSSGSGHWYFDSGSRESGQVPDLLTYDDRTYGTAVMLLTIFVNQIPGFPEHCRISQFPQAVYFFSFFCIDLFFFLLQNPFWKTSDCDDRNNHAHADSPFFRESFYNCKDMSFSVGFWSVWAESEFTWSADRIGDCSFSALVSGCCKYRLIGLSLPAFLLLTDLICWKKKSNKETIRISANRISGPFSFLHYYSVPVGITDQESAEGLRFSSSQLTSREIGSLWSQSGTVRTGRTILRKLIAPKESGTISGLDGNYIPLLYLILFFAEICLWKQFYQRSRQSGKISGWFIWSIHALPVRLLYGRDHPAENKSYHGWRHSYFLYAPFIYLAACGFGNFWIFSFRKGIIQKVKIVVLLGIMSVFCLDGLWVVKTIHWILFISMKFGGTMHSSLPDYWGVASKSCVLDLLNEYNGHRYC